MLSQNKTLEKLSLRDNGISSVGAHAILQSLLVNKALRILNLEKNTFSPTDGKILELKAAVSGSRSIVLDTAHKTQK